MTGRHVEFLCEEPSMEKVLDNLLVKLLPEDVTYDVILFQGKDDLLRKLPDRLQGYKYWTPGQSVGICVLVDEDRQDCRQLKGRLEAAASAAGFGTRSQPSADGSWSVLNRIVVEELEAWFFGDAPALQAAYPRLPQNLASRAAYRDPDGVKGGTWEALERVLQKCGYHKGGLRKLELAEDVSGYMAPSRNTSRSFQVFLEGLEALLNWLERQGSDCAAAH